MGVHAKSLIVCPFFFCCSIVSTRRNAQEYVPCNYHIDHNCICILISALVYKAVPAKVLTQTVSLV